MTTAAAKDGELRHFNAEEAFLETSAGEDIYIYDSRGLLGVPGGMGLLNKIYGLVPAGRCLFDIFCDDKFEQSEVDRRVFRKVDDGKVEMMVFVHVGDILVHAQATMKRFTAELGEKLKVKSMVKKFGIEKASRTPASSGVSALSPSR